LGVPTFQGFSCHQIRNQEDPLQTPIPLSLTRLFLHPHWFYKLPLCLPSSTIYFTPTLYQTHCTPEFPATPSFVTIYKAADSRLTQDHRSTNSNKPLQVGVLPPKLVSFSVHLAVDVDTSWKHSWVLLQLTDLPIYLKAPVCSAQLLWSDCELPCTPVKSEVRLVILPPFYSSQTSGISKPNQTKQKTHSLLFFV
jgi:hypothetical protein